MDAFRQDVVRSVALSCLLTMDYVPKSRPPPIADMVKHELPKVLRAVTRSQSLGPLERELGEYAADPADLLDRVARAVRNIPQASADVIEHGHQDMVFSALMYTRKPPTATIDRIASVSEDVAECLRVNIPDDFDESIGDMYDSAHTMIVRA